jgi:hypothetical protein
MSLVFTLLGLPFRMSDGEGGKKGYESKLKDIPN